MAGGEPLPRAITVEPLQNSKCALQRGRTIISMDQEGDSRASTLRALVMAIQILTSGALDDSEFLGATVGLATLARLLGSGVMLARVIAPLPGERLLVFGA